MAASKYVKLPAAIHDVRRYLSAEFNKVAESISGIVDLLNPLEQTEGAWSPTLIGLTSAGSATYSVRTGQYLKFGKVVVVQFRVTVTGHTGTGNSAISNLPFPVKNATAGHFSGSVYSFSNAVVFALAPPNTSRIDFYGANPNTNLAIAASMDLLGSLTYLTD